MHLIKNQMILFLIELLLIAYILDTKLTTSYYAPGEGLVLFFPILLLIVISLISLATLIKGFMPNKYKTTNSTKINIVFAILNVVFAFVILIYLALP